MKREPQRRDEVLGEWELNDLLHPAQAFESPAAVLEDPDLTVNEKRAILASWASDACAVEAAPDLRAAPAGRVVRFDEIMEALRALDKEVNGALIGASCDASGSWGEDAVTLQPAGQPCNERPGKPKPR